MPAVGTKCKSLTSEEVSYMEAAENADPSAPSRAHRPAGQAGRTICAARWKKSARLWSDDIVFGGSGAEVCERARKATATIAKAVPLLYL